MLSLLPLYLLVHVLWIVVGGLTLFCLWNLISFAVQNIDYPADFLHPPIYLRHLHADAGQLPADAYVDAYPDAYANAYADIDNVPANANQLVAQANYEQGRVRGECVVCLQYDAQVLNIPCGHYVTCTACHDKLEDRSHCIMCRRRVKRAKIIQIYRA